MPTIDHGGPIELDFSDVAKSPAPSPAARRARAVAERKAERQREVEAERQRWAANKRAEEQAEAEAQRALEEERAARRAAVEARSVSDPSDAGPRYAEALAWAERGVPVAPRCPYEMVEKGAERVCDDCGQIANEIHRARCADDEPRGSTTDPHVVAHWWMRYPEAEILLNLDGMVSLSAGSHGFRLLEDECGERLPDTLELGSERLYELSGSWDLEDNLGLQVSVAFRYLLPAAETPSGSFNVARLPEAAEYALSGVMTSGTRSTLVEKETPLSDRSAADVLEDPHGEPQDIIEGALPGKSLVMLVGQPGAAKTFSLLDMGLSVAAGVPWHGHAVQPGFWIHISKESRLRKRLMAWGARQPLGLASHRFREVSGSAAAGLHLADPGAAERIIAYVAQLGVRPKVITFDTLSRFMPGSDENGTTAMTAVMDNAQRLIDELGCSVVFAHHTDKRGTGARGSSTHLGAVDLEITQTKQGDRVSQTWTKRRDHAAGKEIQLRLVPLGDGPDDSCVLEPWDADNRPTTAPPPAVSDPHQLVLEALREHGPQDSKNKLVEAMKKLTRIGKQPAYGLIDAALAAGVIETFPSPDPRSEYGYRLAAP